MPAYVDGISQALDMRKSNNKLRVLTGGLSGVGQVGVIDVIGRYLGKFLHDWIGR